MNWLDFGNITSAVGVSIALNSLWLGALVVALASAAIGILPRSNATTRHTVWFAALLLSLVTPLMLLVPRPTPAAAAGAGRLAAPPVTVPVTAHWPQYMALAWTLVALTLLARIGWSLLHIQGLKKRATEIGRRDGIRILASPEAPVPMAAGFLRRAVVFPQALLDQLTAEEFEQVLSHEMAHLRRGDDWMQLIHAVAQALFFFNPAIHWIGRQLKIEREMACDDWVVSHTGEARPYAACLTHLYELTRRAPAPQLAPGATTKKLWQLSARVEALLSVDHNSNPRLSRSGWVAAAAITGAALVVGAWTSPPVGVQEVPLATMSAQLKAPAAPAIAMASRRTSFVEPRAAAIRPAAVQAKVQAPAGPPLRDLPVVLSTWQVQVAPHYFVIEVVFVQPPPAPLNGI